jgi:hypothetical protein
MERELVDAAQVGIALATLSAAALIVAVFCFLRFRQGRAAIWARAAFLAGAAALAWPLWLVYNGIEDHFGLDSVAALLINLALFALVGTAAGLTFRRLPPADGSSNSHHGDTETQRIHGEELELAANEREWGRALDGIYGMNRIDRMKAPESQCSTILLSDPVDPVDPVQSSPPFAFIRVHLRLTLPLSVSPW